MTTRSDRLAAGIAACVLAALITIPIADSVYQIPIQVSDSLEAIVIATRYASTGTLLAASMRFSATTLRPLRYLQARWLLQTADAAGISYHAAFRTVHVALLVLLVVLFLAAVDVRDWPDLAAFSVAFVVFVGIQTFVAMLLEAFPVNHFAEVGVCALGVFVIAQQRPRWYFPLLVCLLLVVALSVIESGAMVWIVAICCAAAGMRGMTRSSALAATATFGAYLALRYALGIASPGIGGHGSGFGDTFLSADELAARFGAHPLGFMIYNVAGGLASLLFAEPRQGVYSLEIAWKARELHPVVIINIVSSAVMTLLILWYAATHVGARRAAWSDRTRAFVAASAAMVINVAFNAAYMKDEIMSVGGLLYAVAAFVAIRGLLETLPRRAVPISTLLVVLLAGDAALWAFRAVGVHYQLRYDAFKIRNDWIEVLRPDKREDWPRDATELAVTQRIRNEAINRRIASPSFMPRWADRYWVE